MCRVRDKLVQCSLLAPNLQLDMFAPTLRSSPTEQNAGPKHETLI